MKKKKDETVRFQRAEVKKGEDFKDSGTTINKE